ncbi:hypothetical protein [Dictyobacter aurantiacus]|uniref:Uncharacterized protein n=1 Tax=Dictyobacter aurantiacus TaxID=1936993 RepID=A0A401ZKJ8_9CHLR|nr:hypothetical protein [Dictyobacter aurantiacus]GCE07376.1 hypothetical protein KDAU_47050 [Dictyobacter aurantiacus]
MPEQTNRPPTTPGKKYFYQASASQAQITPARSARGSQPANSSQPAGQALAFPVLPRLPAQIHIPVMLFYSVLLIIALTSCLFTVSTPLPFPPNVILELAQVFQTMFLTIVLAPASTLLCALFFGKWRGTLISCLSIYASIQLTHLLNPHFWSDISLVNFLFLIPVMLATFLAGRSYELRKGVNRSLSMFIMIVASIILAFTFIAINTNLNANYTDMNTMMGTCVASLLLTLAWILSMRVIERIVQKALS